MVLKIVIRSATAKVDGTNMYGDVLQTACEAGYTREELLCMTRTTMGIIPRD